MAVLLISDLHLSETRPGINRVFFDFLRGPAARAKDLWILGDLFEYWAGDDDVADPFNRGVLDAIAQCVRGGTRVRVMHGNRDFLMGPGFETASGAQLVDDPFTLFLSGRTTLLTHGDALCTDDRDYQAFRAQVRAKSWQDQFLARSLADRKEQIEALRKRSETEKARKPAAIMDVNPHAVESLLRTHGYPRIIHGHTHRPARHEHVVDGRTCERWVLPDWYETGGALVCDESGCRMERLVSAR
jgi:UDP-2,3-diacylglucosamine hydrolase